MRIPQGLEACGKLLLDALFVLIPIVGSPDLDAVLPLQSLHLGCDVARPRMAGECPRPPAANDKPISHAASPAALAAKPFCQQGIAHVRSSLLGGCGAFFVTRHQKSIMHTVKVEEGGG